MKAKYILSIIVLLAISILVSFAVQASADSGSISGYKINDTDGNGVLDTGEAGINGWTINLIGIVPQEFGYGHDVKVIRLQTTTDENGFYKFDNLPEGRYIIIEGHNPLYMPASRFVINMKLDSAQASANNDFFNKPIIKRVPKIVPPGGSSAGYYMVRNVTNDSIPKGWTQVEGGYVSVSGSFTKKFIR